jgi:hypothetical protein
VSHYQGSVPDAERANDWRDDGLCSRPGEDAEDWFPVGTSPDALAAENHAKAVCWRCPVMEACGQWALEQRESAGIWGGLTEKERRKILKRRGVNLPDLGEEAPAPRTLESIWNANATATSDGHCMWRGYRPILFQGRAYTPQQIGFVLTRGRLPVGAARRTCSVDGCVLPAHLVDQQEREEQTRVTGAAS